MSAMADLLIQKTTIMKEQIQTAEGKLGILLPGMGAVATTMIAGVIAVQKGLAQPIGALTQMGSIRLGKRTENRYPLIKDFVPLAELNNIAFGGWDVYADNVYEAAMNAKVLEAGLLNAIKPELEAITPMKAVFDPSYIKNLDGQHVKKAATKYELAEAVVQDIENFREVNGCNRVVIVWCGSTEKYIEESAVHQSIEAFEAGLHNNDPAISPSMIYAYAAIKLGVPFANGAPNLTCDIPALIELAKETGTPIGGKDFKTGQTLMKTILAPGLHARALGVRGWFSTNILGNRDGYVLDDPDNFKTKEVSKLSVLEDILQPDINPELYGDLYHKVRINYYPPHGDNKESWDNIDIFGWLGYSMQIKINFLCRDSILAAPIVLDLALFMDLAKRANMSGIQEWLSFYFKSPQTAPGLRPEHDIFKQLIKLQNTLRHIMGEDLITHLGLDYYQDLVEAL
jgi:myo-inositol-1-phosphate synthase